RRAVEGDTVKIITELAPLEQEISALNSQIPAPVPNAAARRRQEQWNERLDAAKADVIAAHPELATHLDRFLDPLHNYGSKAAKELRDKIDRPVMGRPRMSLAEAVTKAAHDEGWSPTSGLTRAPELQ